MTDFPGTNDWHGPATHRGVPEIDPTELDGNDRRRLAASRRAALNKANDLRAIIGLAALPDLLPGKPKDPYHCPLAETIRYGGTFDVTVRAQYDEVRIASNTFNLTDAVTNFQCWFDHGFYPDLRRR